MVNVVRCQTRFAFGGERHIRFKPRFVTPGFMHDDDPWLFHTDSISHPP